MKKIALVLVFCLVFAVFADVVAERSSKTIENIYDEFEEWTRNVDSFDQQTVVGLYSAIDMLDVIARAIDKDGQYTESINSVLKAFDATNNSTETVYQQQANGAYSLAEMLGVIAGMYDPDGQYRTEIQGIMEMLQNGDDAADNVYTQQANSLYRSYEMLCLIAQELDTGNQYASAIQEIQRWIDEVDDSLTDAKEQIAFGAAGAAMYVGIIDTILDKNGDYSEFVNARLDVLNGFKSNLDFVQVNSIYQMVCLLQVWGYCAEAM